MIDAEFWKGRRVFLTGHTGFKGAWLSLLLTRLGAEVTGYALAPPTNPSLFAILDLGPDIDDIRGDVRDLAHLSASMNRADPEVVLHLAAQPIVRTSYEEPVETFSSNVMGTVHALEACRTLRALQAIVIVTSDKVYQNDGRAAGYQESDRLGSADPYSTSKACAELVTASYRATAFAQDRGGPALATARAGNVIGGGDWSRDRLLPDLAQSLIAGRSPVIRNPMATRPWQHVLDCLAGYLVLTQRLAAGPGFSGAWNIGPDGDGMATVGEISDQLVSLNGGAPRWMRDTRQHPHEEALLWLDTSEARRRLGWRPVVPLAEALRWTFDWYRIHAGGGDARAVSERQIDELLVRNRTQPAAAS